MLKTPQKKIRIIAGIDEVGRGPLAGPVLAAAITVNPAKIKNQKDILIETAKIKRVLGKLKDSKKISKKKREEVYSILKNNPQVEWGIGRVSEKVIDKINIFQAAKLSMQKAVKNLEEKIKKDIDFLMIDGNFKINLPNLQKSIIKGDEKIFLIKIASIIAKVTRDKSMLNYHKKYPKYQFNKHKGYGTKLHFLLLKKYGPCKLHRKTFKLLSK